MVEGAVLFSFFKFYIMRSLYYFYNLKKIKGKNVFKPNQWQSEGRQREMLVSLRHDTNSPPTPGTH